jgi:hypothetical protein
MNRYYHLATGYHRAHQLFSRSANPCYEICRGVDQGKCANPMGIIVSRGSGKFRIEGREENYKTLRAAMEALVDGAL